MQYRRLIVGLIVIAGLILGGRAYLQATESTPAQELIEAWHNVQDSGAYSFDARIKNSLGPQASLMNAGRESKITQMHMAGAVNVPAESMQLELRTNGGSVLAPETGLEIKVEGDHVYRRIGAGAWEEIENFTGVLAPGGDFTGYLQAAENVERFGPEVRSTVAGDILVRRYVFDISGRQLAINLRGQM